MGGVSSATDDNCVDMCMESVEDSNVECIAGKLCAGNDVSENIQVDDSANTKVPADIISKVPVDIKNDIKLVHCDTPSSLSDTNADLFQEGERPYQCSRGHPYTLYDTFIAEVAPEQDFDSDSDFYDELSDFSDTDSDDGIDIDTSGPVSESVTNPEPDPEVLTQDADVYDEGYSEFIGEKMTVPIKVDGLIMNCLLDTGAQICCINKELAEILKLKTTKSITIKGVNDQPIVARLCPKVNLKIGNKSFTWHVFVAPIREDFILGIDFMRSHKLDISVSNNSISFGKGSIPCNIGKDGYRFSDFDINRVMLGSKVKIPALSYKVVSIPCDANKPQWRMFESFEHPMLYIPNTVYNTSEGSFPLVVFNFSNCCRIFTPKCKLGISHDVKPGSGGWIPSSDVGCNVNKVNIGDVVENNSPVADNVTDNFRFSIKDYDDCFPAGEYEGFASIKDHLPIHIQDLFERSSIHLSLHQSLEVANLLIEFSSTFSTGDTDLGHFSGIEHHIKMKSDKPIRQKLRPTPFHFQEEEEKYLNDMLEAGVIQESNSQYASPVCLVRKKDGGVRYCIDYRLCNAQTIKDAYPLPLIGECLDTLSGNVWFSQLDMAQGYFQISVAEEDRHRTAFICKQGLYEFVRMPFGMSNSPATFSRCMQLVLRGLLFKKCLAFLDDICTTGKSFPEALANVRAVLSRFRQHNLKLKPKKCCLFQKEIEFLGHRVNSEGVSVKGSHLETMENWPVPKTKRELQSLLGFVNYHRSHLPKYAEVSAPLYDYLQSCKPGKFILPENLVAIIDTLKDMLSKAPVLVYPRLDCVFILDVDASEFAIGGELSQIIDGKERVITYASHKLSKAQRRYCMTRLELLSLVKHIQQFRNYLLGKRFIVRTDHNSLVWLMGFKNVQGQLARWLEFLAQFDMVLVHRKGREHVNADALSRIPDETGSCDNYEADVLPENLPCHPCEYCKRAHRNWGRFNADVDDVKPLSVKALRIDVPLPAPLEVTNWVPGYSSADLAKKQTEDHDLKRVIRWITLDKEPSEAKLALSSPTVKHLWRMRQQLVVKEGVLFYKWEDALEPRSLLVVHYDMRDEIMLLSHDAKLAGHMGRDNTYETVRQSFFWYGMYADVVRYVSTCSKCSMNKRPNRHRKAPQVQYHAGYPMERVHLDILGPFTASPSGNKLVLMMVDNFTKWIEACPLPEASAETIANKAVTDFFSRFGMPSVIHTDQGSNFTGQVFHSLCRMLDIAKSRTSGYRPQSNGQVERFNKTLVGSIRTLLGKDIREWDTYIPFVASAIRCIKNRNSGFSANRLMLGREVVKPAEILFGIQPPPVTEGEAAHVQKMDRMLREAHRLARVHLKGNLAYQKKVYDQKTKLETYDVGDFIYKLRMGLKKGLSRKLLSVYEGPYIVTRVISPILFEIQTRKKKFVVHHDKLRPCFDRIIPIWLRRKRQEILSLDDTIAYDEAEQEFDDPELNRFFDDGNGLGVNTAPTQGGSASTQEGGETGTQAPDSTETGGDPVLPCSAHTRTGRRVRPHPRYQDYLT